MIEVHDVVKRYGDKNVVDHVSVNIGRGKITTFIGPNGAGKSTLLAMISRIVDKTAGEIFIEGKRLEQWKSNELAQKISILKQTNHITVKLTIRDLVSFGRFPYSQGKLTKEDWEYVDEAISYMRLADIQDKYLDQLSGGQRQRAFIAMVIAQNTDYVLLDEPLNNLDMKHAVEIMKTMRQLVDELRKTVVLVVHDINFASCYSDYIVALKDGKIAKEGGVEDIINGEVLEGIYEMKFDVHNINNNRICMYYS